MPMVDLIKGMDFGAGADISGRLFGDAVARSEPVAIKDSGGQTVDIQISLAETQEEQDSSLHLSTSVCASYGLSGGSGKFDLSQECHVNDYAISLIVRATVLNSFIQMRDVKFGPTATFMLENGHDEDFRSQFGDMFVRGIQSGGELCVILQIEGHSESDKSEVKANLTAAGVFGAFNFSSENSFSSAVSRASSSRKVKLRHFQVGGTQGASLQPETIINHALNFASEVKAGQQEGFQALLMPYTSVDAPMRPNFIDIEGAKDAIAVIMQKRRDALTRLTSFNIVVRQPENFEIPAGLDVNAVVGQLEIAVARLTSAASRCANAPKEAPQVLIGLADLRIPLDRLPKQVAQFNQKSVPEFVGLSPDTAVALAKKLGVSVEFVHAQSSDDIFGEDLQTLTFAEGGNRAHSDSEIVVNVQRPLPGSLLDLGKSVSLGVALAPGVSP